MAAHAVWSISDLEEGALIPILATNPASPNMQRLVVPMEEAREAFNKVAPSGAVFIFDAFLTLDSIGRTDSLLIEIETADPNKFRLMVGIPYRPFVHADGFAVYRPKILELEGAAEDDLGALMDAFWEGVDSHEQAAPVWNAALDQSK